MEDRTEIEIQISELEDEIRDQQREISELEKRIDALEGKEENPEVEIIESKPEKVCHNCGDPETEKNPLEYTADPYRQDLHGDETENLYCDYCLYNSCMEI